LTIVSNLGGGGGVDDSVLWLSFAQQKDLTPGGNKIAMEEVISHFYK
jgi:hypothetical protein